MLTKHLAVLSLSTLAACSLNAASLNVGDPPPALKFSKWVKGDAVDTLDKNQTYVVEFWATWCGPCKESIPHLTAMAHEYTNVTFIGVDAFEHGDNKESTVTSFVKKMGDKMDYHVAMDSDDQFMADNWMKAAEQPGIPTAFLIQQGQIVWIGHPMELESTLTNVLSGHYDLDKAKKRAQAQAKVKAFLKEAMKGGDPAKLESEGKELEALDKETGGINPDKPFVAADEIKQAKFQAAMQDYQKAVLTGADDAEVAKTEAAALAVAPKDMDFDAFKKRLTDYASTAKETKKANELFAQYIAAVGENGDKDKAEDLGKQIQDLNIKNPQLLNEMAWSILTDEKIKQRDLPLATALAKSGVDQSDGKQPALLDTYAHALFESGKIDDAIDYQKKAVAACDDETMKSDLEAALDKYQAAVTKNQ